MFGPDKGKLEPDKTLIVPDVPEVPYSQTIDFSVSTNAEMSDPDSPQVDVYSTQFAERSGSTAGNKKNDTGKSGVVSDALSSSKNQLPVDIPGFVVESELGRGAFGVVYCARDQFLDRRVAIKKPLISNPAHRQQYIDEARKAVKLDHPSIVPIYQVGMTTNDEPFVVQKLIEGSTLRDLLKNADGKLPLLQTVSIMRQVCLAVDAAHVAGIVHRDLKPENLLVEPEGRVYVADFGLAILEDDEQNKKAREVAGTPLYMSPEQFAGRVEWLDGRSDIWALGVILYELLSGKTPFSGSSLNELKDQIKNKDPRPIHQRDPKIPSAFDAMFRKCCAKNVGDRYASAREMIAELDAITESLPFMDPINLMSQGRTGSFRGISSSVGSGLGSAAGSSQGGLTSQGLNAYGSAQSTLRNSIGGTTVRARSAGWKLIGPFLISLGVLGSLTGAAWFAKLGPFASIEVVSIEPDPNKNASVDSVLVDKVPDPDVGNSLAGSTEKKSSEPKVEPKPLPSKPFAVAIGGEGTHDSIAKAIADSEAGETIRILAGTYRESLVIDRSIKIVGEEGVIILSTAKSCIKVQADSRV
ncbi:MAG TPA: serine/threonine-protein kinase, partial [Pirellula sp.]|nr:serine/threonine-protein kinase [Pirellula sp.]